MSGEVDDQPSTPSDPDQAASTKSTSPAVKPTRSRNSLGFESTGQPTRSAGQAGDKRSKHEKDMEKREFSQRIAIQWSAVAIVVALLIYHVFVVFREGSTKEAVTGSRSILNGVTTQGRSTMRTL